MAPRRHQAIAIPLNKPLCVGRELQYMADAVRRGHTSGDGYYTERCQQWLERFLGKGQVLLTPSGTHALELAALLVDLRPGDEVLMPTFTFPSTANAFVLRGAIPRFVDSRPDTLNLDEEQIEAARYTARTKVICPIHYGGVACEMDRISAAARKHGCVVIEDAAQALGGRFRNRPAGTFGALNAFSFHETKNVSCGEGGALVVTEPRYMKRAEIIRQKGTNRAAFYRGEVDKYTWTDIGSSYVPSEFQAAFLFAQLQKMSAILRARKRLFDAYLEALGPLAERGVLGLPSLPRDVRSSYHLFYIVCESEKMRDQAVRKFRDRGVLAVFHYVPLHLSAMGRRFGYRKGMFPVAESMSGRLLRLPFYTAMTSQEQRYVIDVVRSIFGSPSPRTM